MTHWDFKVNDEYKMTCTTREPDFCALLSDAARNLADVCMRHEERSILELSETKVLVQMRETIDSILRAREVTR